MIQNDETRTFNWSIRWMEKKKTVASQIIIIGSFRYQHVHKCYGMHQFIPFNSIEIDRVEKWNVAKKIEKLNNRKSVMVDCISCLCYLIKHSNRVKETEKKNLIFLPTHNDTTIVIMIYAHFLNEIIIILS